MGSLWDNNRTVRGKDKTASWRVTKACQYTSFKRALLCFFRAWKGVSMRWHVRNHLSCSCCAGSQSSFLDYLLCPCTVPNTVSRAFNYYHLIQLRVHYCTGINKYMIECDIYQKNTRHLKDLFLILEIILNWFQNLFTQSVQLNENKFFLRL